ncbi:FlgO family outer membrane protein [Desulfomarina sp.]
MLSFLLVFASGAKGHCEFIKTKIAVLDFEVHGKAFYTQDMGAIVSEWFITTLVKDGRFDVVERAMLQKILAEQKLGATGLIAEDSASRIGKILGVKIIITGSILHLTGNIEVNSRIINVENGSIIAAENIRCGSESELQTKIKRLTARIVKNFPLTGYIVKRKNQSVMIDLGLDSGIHAGMEFIVYKEGSVIKHPKTGEVLDVEQILTGRIRITRVQRNMAEASVLKEEGAGGISYGQLVKSVQTIRKGSETKNLGDGWVLTLREVPDLGGNELRLTFRTVPPDASIRILNIGPRYFPGMVLQSGRYHVEISRPGYQTAIRWLTLLAGREVVCAKTLSPLPAIVEESAVETKTEPESVPEEIREEISPLVLLLRSNDARDKIKAAKEIINGENIDRHIYQEVEKQLLDGYENEDGGRRHTDAMAWLCKALSSSHDEKYSATLETVRDNSPSFKLTMYAATSLLQL